MSVININIIKKINNSYPVLIEKNILKKSAKIILKNTLENKSKIGKILILTDSNLLKLYGHDLLMQFKSENKETYLYSFKAGENQKNNLTKEKIESFMFKNTFRRDSLLITFGGGVVGDLGGYIASTFNRGISYIQIPSTVIAQIDSSIGGKTGINTYYGKNLLGTFYQPKMVLIDPNILMTLPENQYNSGLVEIIKHAIIKDIKLFQNLSENINLLKERDLFFLEKIIKINCKIKKEIIEKDEKELNLRKILNFGHTISHSIEKLINYKLLHGECLAIGILVEAEISKKLGGLTNKDILKIKNLLKSFALPTYLPKKIKIKNIFKTSLRDKKTTKENTYQYALPKTIGKMMCINNSYSISVEPSIIIDSLQKFIN